VLDDLLREAVDTSFHALNIDGCPSTNDSVFLLASGASGVAPERGALGALIGSVCADLVEQLAADAEGASRVVTIAVSGAVDDVTARRAGMAVADSALVRSSFYGGDPNWGRIVGALGATALDYDPAAVAVSFEDVVVAAGGCGVGYDEAALLDLLAEGDFTVGLRLGDGPGSARVVTTDLTPEYVVFNAERS
jgi:glutamate N-acetyltransferase/amino-acid N-acetyltransferase